RLLAFALRSYDCTRIPWVCVQIRPAARRFPRDNDTALSYDLKIWSAHYDRDHRTADPISKLTGPRVLRGTCSGRSGESRAIPDGPYRTARQWRSTLDAATMR